MAVQGTVSNDDEPKALEWLGRVLRRRAPELERTVYRTEKCEVVLERSPGEGKFVTRGVRINGRRLPLVQKAEIVAAPKDITLLRVEMQVTSVRDEANG